MVKLIENFVRSLNDNQLEYFNERAAIREFEGNMDTVTAEYLAMVDTIRFFGLDDEEPDSV
jgi:hypothetical protein